MKIIYYILEGTNYEMLIHAHTPNIDSLNPHPALSWSRMTRGSVALFLGGFLPTCKIDGCFHNKMTEQCRTFFLDRLEIPLFIGCPCGWVLDLIKPFMQPDDYKLNMTLHDEHPKTTAKLINYFNENYKPLDDYFAYFHVCETTYKGKSIEYVDSLLKPLLDIKTDFFLVSSDHNEKWGHGWGNNLNDFNIFMATRGEWPEQVWRKDLEATIMQECG